MNKAFRRYFTRQFRGYVLKGKCDGKDASHKVDLLCKRIDKATVKLRHDHSSGQLSQNNSSASTKAEEGDEDDIRFSDKVLGDAKRMIAILLFTTLRFY